MNLIKAVLIILGTLIATGVASGSEKKMIAYGWDLLAMGPDDIVNNLDAWEQVPVQGLSVTLKTKLPDGKKLAFSSLMSDKRWEKEWFASDVKLLRQCSTRNLKHLFITTLWAPRKRLAWSDDGAWAAFAHNLGVVAWVARESGAKGLLMDPEDYPVSRQYLFDSSDGDYAATALLARKRGAEVMQAIVHEYPDIKLLSFWLFSLSQDYLRSAEPEKAISRKRDLWPAFLNGLLDALPPAARLIDGNEHAYHYQAARQDFYVSAWQLQNAALGIVAPENHVKYRNQVLVGFGLYLDMYINDPDSSWYFAPLNGSRLNHLHLNFEQALKVTDEYIWVYGEKRDWINWQGTTRKKGTWDESLPGYHNVLARLIDEPAWIARFLEANQKSDTLLNRVTSSNCSVGEIAAGSGLHEKKLPAGFWFWHDNKQRGGKYGIDTGVGCGDTTSLTAVSFQSGCFGHDLKTQVGKEYIVRAHARGPNPSITVAWRRKGSWDWKIPGYRFYFSEMKNSEWQLAAGVVRVPDNVDTIVVMLNATLQDNEQIWYDNLEIIELP